ncbi:MAG: hypothetical protein MJY95_02380 [Bacteroidaceae bacterium]|nr:hypothetical protein [Bacteroidaceae bacterium]
MNEEKDIIDQKEEELTNSEQEKQYQAEKAEAIEAIKKFTDEEESEDEESLGDISIKSILGGDILQSKLILNHVIFFMFIVALMLIYTGNRYASQQDAILIEELKADLTEQRYKVLTIKSELLNASRQSKIVEALKQNGDTLLLHSTTPPFKVQQKEGE